MKYSRLTKEQFESLHAEFANFLAAQQIDRHEWEEIKSKRPNVAEQELDVFSDLVWEGVLSKTEYLEHFSPQHLFLFHCHESHMHSVVIRALDASVSFITKEGLQWLGDNLFTENTEIRQGAKPFGEDRNGEIFALIQQGAILSDGDLYRKIRSVMTS